MGIMGQHGPSIWGETPSEPCETKTWWLMIFGYIQPPNGWSMMENTIRMDDFGGTPVFGNHHRHVLVEDSCCKSVMAPNLNLLHHHLA